MFGATVISLEHYQELTSSLLSGTLSDLNLLDHIVALDVAFC